MLDSPKAAVRKQGEKVLEAVRDGVEGARKFGKDAFTALGQGAEELLDDVRKHFLGPLLVLGALYLYMQYQARR